MNDRLDEMFRLRVEFLKQLDEDDDWPLDLTRKESQRHLRDLSIRGVEEVWEAIAHLRNWKPHRKTDIPDFDREKFLEEWIDALNYFFAALIKAGFTADEVFEMYVRKDQIIHDRLKSGY